MADGTEIVWTDATWNVVLGCDKVSPGCDRCYAIRTAHRMAANPNPKVSGPYEGTEADGDWTGRVNMVEDRLGWPLSWRRPRRIFVNAQSDLFHKDVTDEFIARVFAVMALAPRHTFQILSKRPGRMRSLLSRPDFQEQVGREVVDLLPTVRDRAVRDRIAGAQRAWQPIFRWPLPNVHGGVSVEDQKRADLRIPLLVETPLAVRFLSCEPLLGPVSLRRWLWSEDEFYVDGDGFDQPMPSKGIDWVIVGGESGKGARPMHPAWARTLRDECDKADVPFLLKQWGEWAPGFRNVQMSKDRWQYESIRFAPDGTVYRGDQPDLYSYPGMESVLRVGKHKAGRVLDGRTWDEYPEAVTV